MKLIVNKHTIQIKQDLINEKEINVNECEFEFDEDITNEFVKEAYFTKDDNTYKQIIVNNKCDIPTEVLETKGEIEIGVVAYLVEDEEEIIRYNPSSTYFTTLSGSLKEDAENSEPITPSEMEQYEQALQDGLSEVSTKIGQIDEAITEVNRLDIDATKTNKTTTVTITKKDGTTKQVQILDGQDGANGKDGKDGVDGQQGEQGPQGIQGPQGPAGKDGIDGKDGTNGTNGQDGHTPVKGVDYFTQEDIASLNIPDDTSDLTNGAGYLKSADLKTINSESIVGSGDITISGGGGLQGGTYYKYSESNNKQVDISLLSPGIYFNSHEGRTYFYYGTKQLGTGVYMCYPFSKLYIIKNFADAEQLEIFASFEALDETYGGTTNYYIRRNNNITGNIQLVKGDSINTQEPTYCNLRRNINKFETYPEINSYSAPTKGNQFTPKTYVDAKITTYTGYDATKTQVLKNINGTLTWVDE